MPFLGIFVFRKCQISLSFSGHEAHDSRTLGVIFDFRSVFSVPFMIRPTRFLGSRVFFFTVRTINRINVYRHTVYILTYYYARRRNDRHGKRVRGGGPVDNFIERQQPSVLLGNRPLRRNFDKVRASDGTRFSRRGVGFFPFPRRTLRRSIRW